MNVYELLKINLKALREDSLMTQKELSDKMGVPRANIARYETGENVPPLDVIIKYSKFFDVSVDEILGNKI